MSIKFDPKTKRWTLYSTDGKPIKSASSRAELMTDEARASRIKARRQIKPGARKISTTIQRRRRKGKK